MNPYGCLILYSVLLLCAGWRLRFWSEQMRCKWVLRTMPMQVTCSWCNVIMRVGRQPVSHGICEPCRKMMVFEEELQRAEALMEGRD